MNNTPSFHCFNTTGNVPPIDIKGHCLQHSHQKLFLYGGKTKNGYSKYLYVLNLQNLKWSRVELTTKPRIYSSMVEYNNVLYIFGGKLENGNYSNELINIDCCTFTTQCTTINQIKPRHSHVTVGVNDTMYIFGGTVLVNKKAKISNSCYMYDLTQNNLKFEKTTNIPTCISSSSCVVDEKNQIYLISGLAGGKKPQNTINIFDTTTKQWKPFCDFLFVYHHSSSYFFANSTIVIFGGKIDNKPTTETYFINTRTKKITTENFLKTPTYKSAMTSLSEEVVVGYGGGSSLIAYGNNIEHGLIQSTTHSIPQSLQQYNLEFLNLPFIRSGLTSDETILQWIQTISYTCGTSETILTKALQTLKNGSDEIKDVVKVKEIGSGSFGRVYSGKWLKTTPVALKEISEGESEMRKEIEVLKKVKHPNLSVLYGITRIDNVEYVVMDLMDGSLDKYFKINHNVGIPQKLQMALDCLAGMSYLESMKIIHRDLALRNLLYKLNGEHFTIKVSDFGLSRICETGEYNSTANHFPKRWTAPEAILTGVFTVKSDVWSFGVTLWEILENGKLPYSQFSSNDVPDKVVSGERLPKPIALKNLKIEESVNKLLQNCFKEPLLRPTYGEAFDILTIALSQMQVVEKVPEPIADDEYN